MVIPKTLQIFPKRSNENVSSENLTTEYAVEAYISSNRTIFHEITLANEVDESFIPYK